MPEETARQEELEKFQQALEYVGEGRSLEDTRRLDPLEAVDIASQIAEALFVMHLKGIIHRDLKPSNVLLDITPVVSENALRSTRYLAKVADFGLVRSLQHPDLTQAGDFLGTLYWAAPEQIRNAAQVDKRADLYALGLILYRMLTGLEFPKNYAAAIAILQKAREEGDQLRYDEGRRLLHDEKINLESLELPSSANPFLSIPPQLDDLVLKLLQPSPDERYQGADEVIIALGQIRISLQQSPKVSSSPGLPARSVPLATSTQPTLEEIAVKPLPPGFHIDITHLMDARTGEGVLHLFKALKYTTPETLDDCRIAITPNDGWTLEDAKNIQQGYLLANHDNEALQIFLFELEDISASAIRRLATNLPKRGGFYFFVAVKPTIGLREQKIYEQLIMVCPERQAPRSSSKETSVVKVNRLVIYPDHPTRYHLDVLNAMTLKQEDMSGQAVYNQILSSLSIEGLTKSFYTEYALLYHKLEEVAQRNSSQFPGLAEPQEAKGFAQRLLGRLMFLYFLQKKCWLANDPNFLSNQYRLYVYQNIGYQKPNNKVNFYKAFLAPFFFDTLAHREDERKWQGSSSRPWDEDEVPYLNGGLFALGIGQEYEYSIEVPNELLSPDGEKALLQIFNSYDFTAEEDTPLDAVVSLDPEMLGRMFEEMITERHETGSYYTPRIVVAFMCREALKKYLCSQLIEPSNDDKDIQESNERLREGILQFIDERDTTKLSRSEDVLDALRAVKICDPACGSGAYLVGMLQELLELRTILFTSGHSSDDRDIYKRKLQIVQNNLYGVDSDPIAVSIARLRLWLSLIVDLKERRPLPLPNLDYKIMVGDSLLETLQGRSIISGNVVGSEGLLQRDMWIDEERAELQNRFEALREGGFDIILANPPYVRANAQYNYLRPDEKARQEAIARWKNYRSALLECEMYQTLYEKWDLYIPFLERAYQLLRPRGYMVFIISDSYNAAKYAAHSHEFFLKHATIERIDFCSDIPLFEVGVKNTIIHISKTRPAATHIPVRIRHAGKTSNEFNQDVELLPPKNQGQLGPLLFRPSETPSLFTNHPGVAKLGTICYVSVGMVVNAGEKAHRGAFTLDDLISPTRDDLHSQPFVRGRDISRWTINNIRYLEWGTTRAPAQFRRPTFPELHSAKERLLCRRVSGNAVVVAYCNQQLYSDQTVTNFVPWHYLKDVRNKSLQGTAKYRDEVKSGQKQPNIFREELEILAQKFLPKYLLAIMNSAFALKFFEGIRKGDTDILPDEWKQLPIALIPMSQQREFGQLVDAIQAEFNQYGVSLPPDAAARVSALEKEIDWSVFALYNSTPEEMARQERADAREGQAINACPRQSSMKDKT
jgi:serine/threonine protein kinase